MPGYIIILQAIHAVTVHSVCPIMYKHKSVDGLSHLSTTADTVFSTNEQVLVHL